MAFDSTNPPSDRPPVGSTETDAQDMQVIGQAGDIAKNTAMAAVAIRIANGVVRRKENRALKVAKKAKTAAIKARNSTGKIEGKSSPAYQQARADVADRKLDVKAAQQAKNKAGVFSRLWRLLHKIDNFIHDKLNIPHDVPLPATAGKLAKFSRFLRGLPVEGAGYAIFADLGSWVFGGAAKMLGADSGTVQMSRTVGEIVVGLGGAYVASLAAAAAGGALVAGGMAAGTAAAVVALASVGIYEVYALGRSAWEAGVNHKDFGSEWYNRSGAKFVVDLPKNVMGFIHGVGNVFNGIAQFLNPTAAAATPSPPHTSAKPAPAQSAASKVAPAAVSTAAPVAQKHSGTKASSDPAHGSSAAKDREIHSDHRDPQQADHRHHQHKHGRRPDAAQIKEGHRANYRAIPQPTMPLAPIAYVDLAGSANGNTLAGVDHPDLPKARTTSPTSPKLSQQ